MSTVRSPRRSTMRPSSGLNQTPMAEATIQICAKAVGVWKNTVTSTHRPNVMNTCLRAPNRTLST